MVADEYVGVNFFLECPIKEHGLHLVETNEIDKLPSVNNVTEMDHRCDAVVF
jgi:hypothetical protein